mgnify:CR=1 FL=1
MSELQINNKTVLKPKTSMGEKVRKDFKKNKQVYFMAIPMIVFFILFCYGPMYGILIAFQDYNPRQGISGSTWVGLKHFKSYFNSMYFKRTFKNTALISAESLLFGFPASIILALMINELKNQKFKRVVQTVTYLPQFISLVVICGMVIDFTGTDGLLNAILSHFGAEATNWLTKSEWFRPIYIISGLWQSMGWDSIVYLAALSGIDPTLYEAATIDGAGKWKQLLHVTLPGIAPTIITMLILNIGGLMSVGYSKIILLYNPLTYETSDVISSYAYRRGILGRDYSFSTAVGLIESLIGFALLLIANKLSKKVSETSLW